MHAMEPFLQQRTATVGWLIFLSVSRKDNIHDRECPTTYVSQSQSPIHIILLILNASPLVSSPFQHHFFFLKHLYVFVPLI